MTTEEAQQDGWRATATWTDAEDPIVTVELDRNMGAMWPRAVVAVEARSTAYTAINISPAGVTDDTFAGSHGVTYRAGIAENCVSAIAAGVADGLRGRHGVEITVSSGGVANDTAERVCRYAAQVATMLVASRLVEPRDLSDVLSDAVSGWKM